MEIAYLIIGLIALLLLRAIVQNQKIQVRNQVQTAILLKELINEVSGKDK